MTQAQSICRDAAKLIEKYGWIRNWGGNRQFGFCILGALQRIVKDQTGRFDEKFDRLLEEASSLTCQAVQTMHHDYNSGLVVFNDEYCANAKQAAQILRVASRTKPQGKRRHKEL